MNRIIKNVIDVQNNKFNNDDVISFENMSYDDIIKSIILFQNYENDNNINIKFNFKFIDFSLKKDIIKYFLINKNIINKNIIHNILLLIKSHNTLSDNFFKSNDIYYNSLDELLNIKLDMTDDILEFKKYIISLFFSMLKSLNKFKFSPLDFCVKFSAFDECIFNELDFLTLSSLISNIDYSYDFNQCPYLYDAEIYFSQLVVNHMQTVCLIENFLNNVNKK